MAFFGALALAAVANFIAASTWIFMRVPARVPVKRWMVTLFVSRISFAWAMFLLVVIAVMGSVIDRQLAKPLFRTLIVAMMLGAFWLMATSTVTIVGILWSRDRKSASPSDQSPST